MNAPNGGMSPTSNPTKLTVKREYTGMNPYHSTDQITNQLTNNITLLERLKSHRLWSLKRHFFVIRTKKVLVKYFCISEGPHLPAKNKTNQDVVCICSC